MMLHSYLLRRLVLSFLAATTGLLVFFLPPLALSAVARLGSAGGRVVIGYLPLMLAELGPYLVPLGFLMATISTYGRLAEDREWTAMLVAGFHPLRFLSMPLLLAFLLTAASSVLLGEKVPGLRLAQMTYRRSAGLQVLRRLFPGRSEVQLGNLSLVGRERRGNLVREVVARVPDPETGEIRVLAAEQVELSMENDVLLLALSQVRFVNDATDLAAETLLVSVPLGDIVTAPAPDMKRAKYVSNAEIRRRLAAGRVPADRLRTFRFEAARRDALSASFLVFALLGMPTGLFLRRAHLLAALGASSAYACLYFILSLRIGEALGLHGSLPPELCAWATNAIGVVGGVLCLRWLVRR